MKLLKEFWYGNIEPTEYDSDASKEYKEILRLISSNEEKLQATIGFQKRSTKRRNIIQDTKILLGSILLFDLRVDKSVLSKHQTPFSRMAAGFVFSILILNNSLFVQVIHKADFTFFAVKVPYIRRTGKHLETILNTIGVTQASITYQPNINLFVHFAISNQYPTNKYS